MPWMKVLPRAAAVMLAALVLAGCGAPATMSAQQKDAYDLRRYCEQNPLDKVKCLGYLGDN